ncbi:MAG: hypothetical protein ABWX92_07115 [Mycetocola sp.]
MSRQHDLLRGLQRAQDRGEVSIWAMEHVEELARLLEAKHPWEEHVISEGEKWTVVAVLEDKRYVFTSWDCTNPEFEARRLYDASPWGYTKLEFERVVKYEHVVVLDKRAPGYGVSAGPDKVDEGPAESPSATA